MKMMPEFTTIDDWELLRSYATERAEDAFAEFLRRHIDLVHSAALRQVGGNLASAADVTQAVFLELARKAGPLSRHPALTGWLYTISVYQGSLTEIGNPSSAIVLREREAWQQPNGRWARTYGFADGHSEVHSTDDGDYRAWEAEHQAQPTTVAK